MNLLLCVFLVGVRDGRINFFVCLNLGYREVTGQVCINFEVITRARAQTWLGRDWMMGMWKHVEGAEDEDMWEEMI